MGLQLPAAHSQLHTFPLGPIPGSAAGGPVRVEAEGYRVGGVCVFMYIGGLDLERDVLRK